MSYQFEDESALEELLNQQLDRQRQKQRTGIAQTPSRPSSSKPALPSSLPQLRRPTTATSSRQDALQEDNPSPSAGAQVPPVGQPNKGKLASWLSSGNSNSKVTKQQPADGPAIKLDGVNDQDGPVEVTQPPASSSTTRNSLRSTNDRLRDTVLDETLREERLQELSKQGLIQLIRTQVLPTLKDLRSESASPRELERLRRQLEEGQVRTQSLVESHSEELRECNSRWQQIHRQLELRLEAQEQDFSKTNERHKTHLNELEGEHREQLNKLTEAFQSRLSEEREQFEMTLKRRDEYHQLELESKLKVNCDLLKLEAIFGEWQRMVESTIRELESQFKSVSGLLDKQALEINGSNLELAKKSHQLAEQYERFEEKGDQLGRLAKQLNELLPRFGSFHADNESIAKQTGEQLSELIRRNDELQRLKESIDGQREELARERFQLGLETNRLSYKEQRLGELISWNEQTEARLAEQRKVQMEREAQLDTWRISLDARSKEAKEENHELHLRRRRLLESEEEMRSAQVELERNRKSVADKKVAFERETVKLEELRENSEKELSQLRRLQKSLVCSLCLDRLFPSNERSTRDEVQVVGFGAATKSSGGSKRHRLRSKEAANLEEELTRLSRQSQLDRRELKAESKFVELLSTS